MQRPEAPPAALRRKTDPVKHQHGKEKNAENGEDTGLSLDGAVFSWAIVHDKSAGYVAQRPSLQVAARIFAPKNATPLNSRLTADKSPSGNAGPAFDVGPLALALPAGGILGVVGPVGCGKSTLIMGLLGELRNQQEYAGPIEHKTDVVCGGHKPVGYLSQTPAVVNGSLRHNVTLGMEYDADRYAAAVEAACLGPDIAGMPAGDMTEIGEVRRPIEI